MKQAILQNKVLITITAILLLVALLITLSPALQAEAQGGGYLKWNSYWSPYYHTYVSYATWCYYGGRCVRACRTYYGGWGPCRYDW